MNRLKRQTALILAILMLISSVLVSCRSTDHPSETVAPDTGSTEPGTTPSGTETDVTETTGTYEPETDPEVQTEPPVVLEGDPISGVYEEIVGDIRVQIYSDACLRIEYAKNQAFFDERTLAVTNRSDWEGITVGARREDSSHVYCQTRYFTVVIPKNGSVNDVQVFSADTNQRPWRTRDAASALTYLPAPGETPGVWGFADNPRITYPENGFTELREGEAENGWKQETGVRDYYVFAANGDPLRLRDDYNRLVGRCDLPTVNALGMWFSRYHAYSSSEVISLIDAFRKNGYGLDYFVVDTDWRVGGSTGYEINTNLFPNMRSFLTRAHGKNVRIAFNDHVRPYDGSLLDAAQLAWFNEQLVAKLELGLDTWWYDRNWTTGLNSPFPDVRPDYLGQFMYYEIERSYFEKLNRRTELLSNFNTNFSGNVGGAPYVGSHRASLQWSGDIQSSATALAREVGNMVNLAALTSAAYLSSDIGGHFGKPAEALFIRWTQYGMLAPIMRYHSSNADRTPWVQGKTANEVALAYNQMRYRLMPLFYELSYENYALGLPMVRRLDFYYEGKEAAANDQYLLGEDVLVAPMTGTAFDSTPLDASLLHTPDGKPGLLGSYFNNVNLSGTPVLVRTDESLTFDWGAGSPDSKLPADRWSARWEGTVTAGDEAMYLGALSDDGIRIWVDGMLIVDNWQASDSTVVMDNTYLLPAHTQHDLKVEYYEDGGNARIMLVCKKVLGEVAGPDYVPEAVVPSGWLSGHDGQPGLTGTYYGNMTMSGTAVHTSRDHKIDFNWGTGSPASSVPSDKFSAVWEGVITIGECDVYLGTLSDDGVRLWVDGELIIDNWKASDSVTVYNKKVVYKAGSTHDIRIEYYEEGYNAVLSLKRMLTDEFAAGYISESDMLYTSTYKDVRSVWIPEGEWIDLFTGDCYVGPQTVMIGSTIRQSPLLVKKGAILPLAPAGQYNDTSAWDKMTLDVYVGEGLSDVTMLYEDDGTSLNYKAGLYRLTKLSASTKEGVTSIRIRPEAPVGEAYDGGFETRTWTLRLHTDARVTSVTVNGQSVPFEVIARDASAMPFATEGGSPDGSVVTAVFSAGVWENADVRVVVEP